MSDKRESKFLSVRKHTEQYGTSGNDSCEIIDIYKRGKLGYEIMKNRELNRRTFLKGAAGAAAIPLFYPAVGMAASSPNNRIGVACIGMGQRGRGSHLRGALSMSDLQVLAVCDPQKNKAEGAKKATETHYARKKGGSYKGCEAYADFRKIMERPDIDVVFIAAPENLHALISVAAMKAGKDVYCEKAMTLTVDEGRKVVDTVRRYGRVFQLGTQQRSSAQFRHACELTRNGYLGDLKEVRIGVPGGRTLKSVPAAEPPAHIDYDLWLGPAPWTPYDNQKCSFNWYFMSDYCAGFIQSWGVHHCDIAAWGVPNLCRGKVTVEGKAEFPKTGPADTSISWLVKFTMADGVVCSFANSKTAGHGQGVQFIGEKGDVHVRRGGIRTNPGPLKTLKLGPTDERLYDSRNHLGNFIDCVRSRRDPVANVEAGHRATTISLIADIATRLERKLTFDWEAERFVGDDGANAMLSRTYRAPWRI